MVHEKILKFCTSNWIQQDRKIISASIKSKTVKTAGLAAPLQGFTAFTWNLVLNCSLRWKLSELTRAVCRFQNRLIFADIQLDFRVGKHLNTYWDALARPSKLSLFIRYESLVSFPTTKASPLLSTYSILTHFCFTMQLKQCTFVCAIFFGSWLWISAASDEAVSVDLWDVHFRPVLNTDARVHWVRPFSFTHFTGPAQLSLFAWKKAILSCRLLFATIAMKRVERLRLSTAALFCKGNTQLRIHST